MIKKKRTTMFQKCLFRNHINLYILPSSKSSFNIFLGSRQVRNNHVIIIVFYAFLNCIAIYFIENK